MPTEKRGTAVTRVQVLSEALGIGAKREATAAAAVVPPGETATGATTGPTITETIGPLNVPSHRSDRSHNNVGDKDSSSSNNNSLSRPP